jgi:hypothetical protein
MRRREFLGALAGGRYVAGRRAGPTSFDAVDWIPQ